VAARSDFLRRRADLLRRIHASVSDVTKAFKKLTLAEMHAGYAAVMVEREDPLCALVLKRYVSESVFRAYLLKEEDIHQTARAYKELVADGFSEDLTIYRFACAIQSLYQSKRYTSYLERILAEYGSRIEEHIHAQARHYRQLKRGQQKMGF
jgi:hypothetical protein